MSNMENPLVFISYTVKDQMRVLPFYDYLEHHGINVWMDCKRLKGGCNWDLEIKKAHRQAALVIIFLSKNFIEKRGYNQREVKMSLKNLEEKLDDDIYIIPVLLDDIEQEQIERPVALQHIQMINGYLSDGKEQILDSIKTQFEKMKIELKNVQEEANVFWTVKPIEKSWDGFPGYKVRFDFIEFQSNRYKDIDYIADIINGKLTERTLETMSCRLVQEMDFFNNEYTCDYSIDYRTSAYDGRLHNINIKSNIISIQYDFDAYNAGGAHGNQWTECYNFTLNPLTKIESISWLLKDEENEFSELQQIIRNRLIQYLHMEDDDEWGKQNIIDGTQEQKKLSNFAFLDRHIEFKFYNYQVCCYAQGNPSISISYDEIYHLLSKHAKEQLGLEKKLD